MDPTLTQYPIRTFFYSRIGERSSRVAAEELKKGVKAFNINGGLIEWLHFDGYGQKTILSGLATVISPTKRRKRSTWLRRDLPVWCLLASRPCIPIVLVSSFQTSPCVMGIMSEL